MQDTVKQKDIILVLLCIILTLSQTPSVSVSSSSSLTGQTTNYTFAVSNLTDLTRVDFGFSSWTLTNKDPFSSGTLLLVSDLTITPTLLPLTLIGFMPSTLAFSSLQLTLTNMRNPSSTKPYPITITLYHSSGSSSSVTVDLTISSISNSSFPMVGYSISIGSTSNSAELYLSPQYALHMTNTFLEITYDSTMITMSLGSSSTYTIISTSTNTFLLGSFSSSSLSLLRVTSVSISNPEAAISTIINCRFYLLQSGIQYNIQAFYASITLTPAAFSSLSSTSSLEFGVLSSLSIVSSCQYTQVSSTNPSNPAYTIISYDNSQIQPESSSNCIAQSTTTCKHTLSGTYSLTSWLPLIASYSSTNIIVTSYTFYQGQYYSLCQSTLSLPVSQQVITPILDLQSCIDTVSSLNTVTITADVNSIQIGDILYITGFSGVVADTNWTLATLNSASWYYYTISASDLTAISSTASTLTASFSYYNPNFTATSNSLTNINIYRSTISYSASSSPVSLCSTSVPKTITTSSLIASSLNTYSLNTLQLQMTMQLFDYQEGDFIVLNFAGDNGAAQYLLSSSILSLTVSTTINNIAATTSSLNSTALQITLTTAILPSQSNPVMQILINNIVNPPFVSNIWIEVTTHSQATGGIKQTLTSSSLAIVASSLTSTSPTVNLLANNSVSFILSNPNRNILSLNSSSSSSLTITLPTQISCSSLIGNSLSFSWLVGVTTSGTLFTGNTTHVTINLGSCAISYFSSSPSMTITQSYNSLSSTSTSLPVVNICGDNCYTCSSSICTSCFNSTYTTFINLYSSSCHQTCPSGSYQSSTAICSSCHISCSTCSGGSYLDCSACASNYLNDTAGYCLSICGSGKYLSNGICTSCHANCIGCESSSVCYACKTNATLIGNTCEFTSCFGSCSSCLGSQSTCTSCISAHYLYNSACYSQCPQGTYSNVENSIDICTDIKETNAFIPVTISGMIGTLILVALRFYSSKKVGNQSRRSKTYTNQQNLNYKINLLRVTSILFTYLQIIAAIVIAGKNSTYNLSTPSTTVIAGGLILHLLSNIAFLIGYCCIVMKKTEKQDENKEQDHPASYKIIMVLSVCLSYRSYKLLFSNLFVNRSSQKTVEGISYPNDDINNPMSKITTKSAGIPSLLPAQSTHQKEKKQIMASTMKKSSILKNSNKQNQPQNKMLQSVPSKKPIQFNSVNTEDIQEHQLRKTNLPLVISAQQGHHKTFTHPFLTYLTFINLLLATLVLLVGCCVQIYQSTFSNMLFWGVDALIVVIISFFLTAWDLWNFTNLKKEEQQSQMSSQNAQINHTHQNLKQAAEIEVQVQIMEESPKSNKKRNNPIPSKGRNKSGVKAPPPTQQKPKIDISRPPRPKVSLKSGEKSNLTKEEKMKNQVKKNQSSQKRQKVENAQEKMKKEQLQKKKLEQSFMQEQPQKPPMLKIFEDFDEKEEIFRQTKSKKFNAKSTRYGKKVKPNASVTNTKKFQVGELFDDLYINFPRQQMDGDHSTTYNYRSQNSRSPNRSLQDEQGLEIEEDFQEMPPVFPDISDIQDELPPDQNGSSQAPLEPKQDQKEQ